MRNLSDTYKYFVVITTFTYIYFIYKKKLDFNCSAKPFNDVNCKGTCKTLNNKIIYEPDTNLERSFFYLMYLS